MKDNFIDNLNSLTHDEYPVDKKEPTKNRIPTKTAELIKAHRNKLSDISHGCWYSIHLLAARGKYLPLIGLLETFSEAFVCVICREHISEYLKENPIPKIENFENVPTPRVKRIIFDWTIEFHNAVSKRIDKRQITEDEATFIFMDLTEFADKVGAQYSSTKECTEGCGDTGNAKVAKNTRLKKRSDGGGGNTTISPPRLISLKSTHRLR